MHPTFMKTPYADPNSKHTFTSLSPHLRFLLMKEKNKKNCIQLLLDLIKIFIMCWFSGCMWWFGSCKEGIGNYMNCCISVILIGTSCYYLRGPYCDSDMLSNDENSESFIMINLLHYIVRIRRLSLFYWLLSATF